ncbi:MAG TPA: FtsX-like permease family protein [Candidatus Atribacteria bacterium]|nr:FtsX-like permease family protein [Candidatus Atribacteria bacterium]
MKFLVLAYKNLKRRKSRSFLTIGGVAVAVAVLVCLLGFNAGYQKALTSDVDKMGYQVVVTAKGCPYEAATMILNGEAGLKFIDEDIYKQITSDPDIDKITPLLAQLAYDPEKMEGKGGFTNYLGIEESYMPLKPNVEIIKGEWFSANDANEAILGYDAAESEKKSIGDKISIPGKDITLTIVGVFNRTGSQEDGTVFLPLKTTQRIFDIEGKLTGIGIKLKQIEKISEFEDRLYPIASIQVISMSQVKGTILNLVNSAKILIMSVAFIAIFVAIIGVINTILMSVFERTQEIGIMKAIGASRLDIFQLIWMETLIVCTLGGIFGSVIAIFGGNLVEILVRKVMPYTPGGKLLLITPELLLFSFLGVIIVGIISGVYPAFKAASMRPIEVIRSGE